MGASSSKTAAEIINETTAQVLISNANDCSASMTGIQVVRTSGLTFGQLNYASMRLTQSCIQNITITNDIIDKITNAIDQQARAQVTALLPGGAFAKTSTQIRNAVTSNITNTTIQNAMANLTFGQDIGTSGITIGQANVLSGDVVLKAMQTAVANTNLSHDLGTDVGQSANATTDTSPISQLFSGLYGWIAIVVIIFIIIVGGIAALNYFGASGSNAESMPMLENTEPMPMLMEEPYQNTILKLKNIYYNVGR